MPADSKEDRFFEVLDDIEHFLVNYRRDCISSVDTWALVGDFNERPPAGLKDATGSNVLKCGLVSVSMNSDGRKQVQDG